MARKHVDLRLSEDDIKNVKEYMQKFNLNTFTEAVSKQFQRWKYLDGVDFAPLKEEALKCVKRVRIDGEPYCTYKPLHGIIRFKKLPSVGLCVSCREQKIGLTESSLLKQVVAGQEDLEQPKRETARTAPPSPFPRSLSPPDPITRPAPVSSIGFSCPIFKNRAYCNANPCDHRKQCREVGRIPHG
jgi:hypothetical protein